jgi:hypothetical protein
LRTILNDPKRVGWHSRALASLTQAGGGRVGDEIARLVSTEVAFMKQDDSLKTAKSLDELSYEARHRYETLADAIRALERIEYPGAIPEVRAAFDLVQALRPAGEICFPDIAHESEAYLSKYAPLHPRVESKAKTG